MVEAITQRPLKWILLPIIPDYFAIAVVLSLIDP